MAEDGQSLTVMKEKDLVKKVYEELVDTSRVSDSLVEMMRSGVPQADWKLTDDMVDNICHNVSHGVPIDTCAACVCVTPQTLRKWLKKGQEEVCGLTEEQLDEADNVLDILSPYGRLFLKQAQAKGNLVSTIMDIIYDKMPEQHNEWLLTYLLERLDPETFNLKYKIEKQKLEQTSTNVNMGTQNFVNIQFVNGLEARPEEDREYIMSALDSLKGKYDKKHEELNITPKG